MARCTKKKEEEEKATTVHRAPKINFMASLLNWHSWRMPSVKYVALVPGRSKNSRKNRSSSIGGEENRPLVKENANRDDEGDNVEPPMHMHPPKKAYCRLGSLIALLCLAFLACGALLGYAAGGLRVWRGLGDNGTTGTTTAAETAFGNEYNKNIYEENEFGERYCPDEALTLRREWRKIRACLLFYVESPCKKPTWRHHITKYSLLIQITWRLHITGVTPYS